MMNHEMRLLITFARFYLLQNLTAFMIEETFHPDEGD